MPVRISWSFNPGKFRSDESGDILVFSVFTLVVMAIIGGIAVDIGYYERSRTDLQTSLDSAVLAAASLSQDMEPQEVVESYMASAGFSDLAIDVVSTKEEIGDILVGRTVKASLLDAHETLLMRLFGQETLDLGVTAQATERVEDIEISLVLDVSGSMGLNAYNQTDYRKINALKSAARDFVQDILSEAEEDRVSISIVPYSTKVNAGEALLSAYTVSDEHTYSHCLDFEEDDFLTSGIDPDTEHQRTGHFQFQGMDEGPDQTGPVDVPHRRGVHGHSPLEFRQRAAGAHRPLVPRRQHVDRHGGQMGTCPARSLRRSACFLAGGARQDRPCL